MNRITYHKAIKASSNYEEFLESFSFQKTNDLNQLLFQLAKELIYDHDKGKIYENILYLQKQFNEISFVNEIELPPYDEFFKNFYLRNLPAKIYNLVTTWPAFTKWTPDYFLNNYGEASISYMNEREEDKSYDYNRRSSTITIKEFIKKMSSVKDSNDFYLTGANPTLRNTQLKDLLKDILLPKDLFHENLNEMNVGIWIGPKGTITNFHIDKVNNILCQIYGDKEITLVAPYDTPFMYPHDRYFSKIGPLGGESDDFPDFKLAKKITISLKAGEALFIPVGWWHKVTSLSNSISISVSAFRVKNLFEI
ncbi:MAG TPA: cupin-like domain-containing protein [Bacteroidia bacterium]|jgi:hypothetical protein|nr:cupin-like domain-containing protein [Bacteroidia bacterium]